MQNEQVRDKQISVMDSATDTALEEAAAAKLMQPDALQAQTEPTIYLEHDWEQSRSAIESRMAELQAQHVISQRYFFPFPYLCQIYHLLNLKHLESVHGFSLNNLEVLQVNHFQSTEVGGIIKFQTVLRSPFNILRLWRQPIVEVDLTLHDPYTVELNIPIYRGKQITVLFNVIPLQKRGHQLFIDIYTNLIFPKAILKPFLHLAAGLTVLEDLPYIRRLAERNLERLVSHHKVSDHETMQLFKRFAELYGSGV